ncbi:fumarylacetoacetate hydrolase [Fusarium beomiforme]|uniref:Fumarylacetoacetase n=1 Tax=Fusarium beomiforme TaxID=44412 RepID=A0A9P5AJM6_9HYPO|nr:fumarylacetoacetate hydrolase [Fusarium beomiforme]
MAAADFAHHFTEKNIPFGIASSGTHKNPQAVTRLENTVVFLNDLVDHLFKSIDGLPLGVFSEPTLNSFAALSKTVHQNVRKQIQQTYQQGGLDGFPSHSKEDVKAVTMHLPVEIKDFADFSCSLDHVINAGRIVVNNGTPPPGFFHFPVGYQGRTGSIVVSGTDIERPYGQFKNPTAKEGENPIIYGPSQKVDYEVELAAVVGKPLAMKQRLHAKDAEDHIFGFVILNDWSARDIQGFEMFPLGPFNDALEPFRTKAAAQKSISASYLQHPNSSTFSITMKVEVLANSSATTLGVCPVEALYWTPQQMVAHSVSSGSALRTGDLLATGTVSGSEETSRGCMLETTEGGSKPVTLSDGSKRGFLEDGDVVKITASVGEEGSGVGFGECIGRLTAARPY